MCKLHGVRLIKGIKIFESMSYEKNPAKFRAIIIIPTKFFIISTCRDKKF